MRARWSRRAIASVEDQSVEGAVWGAGPHLTAEQLGDLFAWMEREYPHSDDRVYAGAHFVGERELIERWRDLRLPHPCDPEVACVEAREQLRSPRSVFFG